MLYHFPAFFFNRSENAHKKPTKIAISFHYIHFYYYFCTIFSDKLNYADYNYKTSVRNICI